MQLYSLLDFVTSVLICFCDFSSLFIMELCWATVHINGQCQHDPCFFIFIHFLSSSLFNYVIFFRPKYHALISEILWFCGKVVYEINKFIIIIFHVYYYFILSHFCDYIYLLINSLLLIFYLPNCWLGHSTLIKWTLSLL